MHKSHGFLGFFLLVVFVVGYYLLQRQQASVSILPPSQQQVLSAVDQNAQCHPQYLNASDLQAVLPDPNCTPGAINPDVTQDNLDQTICHRGFTKTIRPPVSYTNKLKREQIVEYGFKDTSMRSYEEDHYISLELGGSPDDPKNLWPEPHGSPNEKDFVENYLNQQVCDRKMTLEEAQKEISTNWYAVYRTISQ